MKKGLLSDEEIRQLLQPEAEKIIEDIKLETNAAVREFYEHYNSYEGNTYSRTGTFINFATKGDTINKGRSLQVVFKYSSDDISVNPWNNFSGDVNWSFDADFVNGWHGGPRRTTNGWTWDGVRREDISPWNRIKTYVEEKY